MDKIKDFFLKNKKEILVFLGGFVVAMFIFGGFFINSFSNNKVDRVEVTNERKAKEKEKKKSSLEDLKVVENDTREMEVTDEVSSDTPLNNETVNNSIVKVSPSVQNTNPIVSNESSVISYFREQESLATGNQNDPTIRERLKSGVDTIYRFLFEGGTIRGKTFKELSTSAKLQVMKITIAIDQKIDAYFPNYKNRIKQGYNNLKAKVVTKYLEETSRICANNENLCATARNDFQTMKRSYSLTFSLIKDLAKSGSAALKEWYLSIR